MTLDFISFVAFLTCVTPLAKDFAIEGILSAPKTSNTIKKIKTNSVPLIKRNMSQILANI